MANLGQYPVSITNLTTSETRQFPVDTSFEPYRREAFRHRTIPAQRQSIMLTNIAGEGTVNTEGLWRREQVDYSMGAGQAYLDRKGDSQETRFLSSKGIDVFGGSTNSTGTTPYPLQATLLADTFRKDGVSTTSGIKMSRCGDYVVVVGGSTVYIYKGGSSSSAWALQGTGTYSNLYNSSYSSPGTIYDIATNDSYCYLATSNGIWFGQINSGSFTFYLYAAPDSTPGFTGGYTMVKWANDQLIASYNNRLYAFLPRVASPTSGGSSSNQPPYYGAPPSVGNNAVPIQSGTGNSSGTITVTTTSAHGLTVGQQFTLSNTTAYSGITALSYSSAVMTATLGWYSGSQPFAAGDTISVTAYFGLTVPYTVQLTRTETATITSVSGNTISWNTTVFQANDFSLYSYLNGNVNGVEAAGFDNTTLSVASVPSTTSMTFTSPITIASSSTVMLFSGGSLKSSSVPDQLYDHPNTQWVWSDATGGMTQVYFTGYAKGASDNYSGCVYRSDLPGAATSSTTNIGTVSSTNSTQPWYLSTPIQALPMSPDEYPTCIQSYLNYIFIGTNRGIRMAQTLSIYDPTATATGDLKSGPLIPNILQPMTSPVTGIVGDGRFVWFSWSYYDGSNSGLGKLDLSTFIAGDPLAPAYASDIMFPPGKINYLDWDPVTNTPIAAIDGYGCYAPYAQNTNGIWNVNRYVSSGQLTTGAFDYGIPDLKIPVYFDYGAIAQSGSSVSATLTLDPHSASPSTISVSSFTTGSATEYALSANTKAQEFAVTLTLNAGSSQTVSPVLRRWALKSWPAVVQGTEISVVLQLFQVNEVDGQELYVDPYDNFTWLETRRQNQDLLTYQEGPLSVTAVIDGIDWIPHKRRDTYQNGFEGDLVLSLKTISTYSYSLPTTV